MSEITAESPVLADEARAIRPVKAPARQAMILICRRCERRIEKGGDGARRLARRLRKLSKEELGKGAVRTVFTSCMSLCPRDALTVAVVPGGKGALRSPVVFITDAAHPKAAARQLLTAIKGQ